MPKGACNGTLASAEKVSTPRLDVKAPVKRNTCAGSSVTTTEVARATSNVLPSLFGTTPTWPFSNATWSPRPGGRKAGRSRFSVNRGHFPVLSAAGGWALRYAGSRTPRSGRAVAVIPSPPSRSWSVPAVGSLASVDTLTPSARSSGKVVEPLPPRAPTSRGGSCSAVTPFWAPPFGT